MAQDDEGFEIADFGADDSGDEEEGGARGEEGPRYDDPTRLSKPKPTKDATPATRQPLRESLDGETIFAVGEDGEDDGDKWSEDEDSSDSGNKKLVENGKSEA